jgi:hypothetical protein
VPELVRWHDEEQLELQQSQFFMLAQLDIQFAFLSSSNLT